MIAKLSTLPPASPPSADQAFNSAESKQQTIRLATFEQTLSHRRRAERQRDDEADAPVVTKQPKAKTEQFQRAEKTNETTQELAGKPEVSGDEATVEPVVDDATEPVNGTDEENTQIELAAEASEAVIEVDESEAAALDESAEGLEVLEAVQAVAGELLQQVTQSMASPVEAIASPTQTSATITPSIAATNSSAPVKKNENIVPGAVASVDEASLLQGSAATSEAGNEIQPVAAGNVGDQGAPTPATASASEHASAAGIPLEKPAMKVAAATTDSPVLPSVHLQATAPTSSPSAVVGESLSAQLAQLSQGEEDAVRDQINVGRLTRGLNSAVNQRGGSVTLRLTPPELGLVRIDMAVRDGVVNAKFTAQSESVRNLLMDQMGQLRQALDRQGLSVDKIEVQITQQSASSASQRQSEDLGREGRSAGEHHARQGQREATKQQLQQTDRDTFDRALAGAAT